MSWSEATVMRASGVDRNGHPWEEGWASSWLAIDELALVLGMMDEPSDEGESA